VYHMHAARAWMRLQMRSQGAWVLKCAARCVSECQKEEKKGRKGR
jgi:hypothetical protein